MRGCGNSDCKVSTGIHEGLTFGSGELDDLGYWEKPCGLCARLWEKKYPEDGPCWPFKQEETMDLYRFVEGLDPEAFHELLSACSERLSTEVRNQTQEGKRLTYAEEQLICNGQKIQAVKAVRNRLGLGLKESKDLCDDFERRHGLRRE